ncbi:MAG: hypothetical protein OXS33_08820, partial [bacterium]|nr:hypothetical protein [bacterium]
MFSDTFIFWRNAQQEKAGPGFKLQGEGFQTLAAYPVVMNSNRLATSGLAFRDMDPKGRAAQVSIINPSRRRNVFGLEVGGQ